LRDSLQHPRPSPSWLMRLSRKRLNRSQSCNYNKAPSGSHSLSPLSRTLRANIIQRLSCREWTGPIFVFTPSLRTHCGECSWAARCSQRRVPLQSDQRNPQHQAPSMTSSKWPTDLFSMFRTCATACPVAPSSTGSLPPRRSCPDAWQTAIQQWLDQELVAQVTGSM